MRSRTLSSDLRILGKDLTRFAPVWLGYSVVLILMLHTNWDNGTDITGEYNDTATIFALIHGVYGIVCAMSLFGYLTEPRECNLHHSLPVRREEYFIVHLFSGFLMCLIPTGIFLVCQLPLIWYGSSLVTLAMILLEFTFFFGLGVLCVFLTGRKLGAFTLYGLANIGSMLVYLMLETLFLPLLPGVVLPSEGFLAFCPALNILDMDFSDIPQGEMMEAIGVYALVGVGMLTAALLLYRSRKLERAGDFLAVRWLEPVLATAVSLACGCVVNGFGSLFYYERSDFLLALGLIVGWFAIWMLMGRTVKVFRPLILAGGAAVVAGVFCSMLLVEANAHLWTQFVPEPEEVESIELMEFEHYGNSLTVTEPEAIGELTDMHRLILTSHGDAEFDRAMYLTYHLKDGRTVRRYYQIMDESALEMSNWYYSQPEILLGVETFGELEERVVYFSLDSNTTYQNVLNSWDLTQDQRQEFLGVLFQDCRDGNMFIQVPGDLMYNLYISGDDISTWVYISKDALDTLAWIEQFLAEQ